MFCKANDNFWGFENSSDIMFDLKSTLSVVSTVSLMKMFVLVSCRGTN